MSLSIEEYYVKKIENGIRGIRLGTKTPKNVNLSEFFKKLKILNDGLCEDLLKKYDNVVKNYKRKIENNNEKVW